MVGVEPIENLGTFGASCADLRKQQFAFLRVVDLLRKLVDVEQHRPQHREVGQGVATPVLREQRADRTQDRGQRAVLVADHEQRRMGGHRILRQSWSQR